jgi:hypothetical protein
MKRTLLAVLAIGLVAFAAGCGSDSKSSSASPSEAVQDALTKTSEIKSGKADVTGSLSVGSLPGSLAIEGGGPFDTEAEGGAATDLQFSVNVAGTEQKFGLVSVDGKSYLTVDDKALEQKDAQSLQPDQIADFIAGLGKNLTNVKSTGDDTYTATVDVKKMLEESKAGDNLSKLSIPGLGSGQQLAKSVSTANITVTVNAEGYAEVLDVDLPITTGGNQGGVRATITLSEIDEPQTIEPPRNVVNDASELGGLGAALANQ